MCRLIHLGLSVLCCYGLISHDCLNYYKPVNERSNQEKKKSISTIIISCSQLKSFNIL